MNKFGSAFSQSNFSFKGNWLVNYDPKKFNYPGILITLAQIQDYFKKNCAVFSSINIIFDRKAKYNYFFRRKNDIYLNFREINAVFEEIDTRPCVPAVLEPFGKPIKTISLLFPRLESDPRWKTIGIPSGQLFLASSLASYGFEATPLPLILPAANLPPEALETDLAGVTLFEDLLPVLRPFLARFRAEYKGILAAGGPFTTLAPLAAAYHLPQVNLFVRGEAEMVLPGIIQALEKGDTGNFFSHKGVYWQQPGMIALSAFDRVNRPEDLSAFRVDFDFLKNDDLGQGLEMNFSRGCIRGCMFCCRAQGLKFRKLPHDKAEEFLIEYSRKTAELQAAGKAARTVNINDDDILQDPAYAREIFSLLKKRDFRIYGVQTSPASLLVSDGSPGKEVLDLVADPGLYADGRPLLWLGTDTLMPQRAKRLGKPLPAAGQFAALLGEFEKRGLRHFHYWISSDGETTWAEFVEELSLIFGFSRDYPGFRLLAHAPFIVPYPASSLFGRMPDSDQRLKIKLALEAPDPRFSYKIVERMETCWPQLNALLRNEKAGGEKGFFDFLKEKDFIAAAQLAYHFLKQEQLQSPTNDPGPQSALERMELLFSEHLSI